MRTGAIGRISVCFGRKKMKKSCFTVFLLIFVLILTSCGNGMLPEAEEMEHGETSADTFSQTEKDGSFITNTILFPAYKLDNPQGLEYYDQLNSTASFKVTVDFPKNWTIKEAKKEETVPIGELYTPVYIYEEEELVGYIGFDIFEPYTEEIEQEQYYQTVYPKLRLSSIAIWDPYTAIKTTDTSETGLVEIEYMDPDEIDQHPGAMPSVPTFKTLGILSYDTKLKVYIGIAFMPDTIEREQVEAIAKTVSLSQAE